MLRQEELVKASQIKSYYTALKNMLISTSPENEQLQFFNSILQLKIIPLNELSPLIELTIKQKNPTILRTLLKHGVPPNNSDIVTATNTAISARLWILVDIFTEELGYDEKNPNQYNYALTKAVLYNQFDTVDKLLSVNALQKNSDVLFTAVTYSDAIMIKKLLDAGADASVKETKNEYKYDSNNKPANTRIVLTPIMMAAQNAKTDSDCQKVNIFAETLRDPENKYGFGQALVYAAKRNQLETAKKLIQAGARPDCIIETDEDRETPLHHAVHKVNPKMVQLLLEAGAKQHQNYSGLTPLDLAATRGHFDIVMLFVEHQARQQQKTAEEKTVPSLSSVGTDSVSKSAPIRTTAAVTTILAKQNPKNDKVVQPQHPALKAYQEELKTQNAAMPTQAQGNNPPPPYSSSLSTPAPSSTPNSEIPPPPYSPSLSPHVRNSAFPPKSGEPASGETVPSQQVNSSLWNFMKKAFS